MDPLVGRGPLGPRLCRCLLFTPADRPERLAKAVASGADAVCMDLEDAVAPEAKTRARAVLLEQTLPSPRRGADLIVRINDPATEAGQRDLEALVGSAALPDAIMVPKVASSRDVSEVARLLATLHPGVRLIPMIETARALAHVEAIASASPMTVALQFGGIDLARELGCEVEWDALLYARSRTVHAAVLGGVSAIDVPRLDLSSDAALAQESDAVRRLGFSGKAAIHPSQVGVIQDAFTPTGEEVERAAGVVQAFDQSGGAPILRDGRLIDKPVADAAHRVLALDAAIRDRSARAAESP